MSWQPPARSTFSRLRAGFHDRHDRLHAWIERAIAALIIVSVTIFAVEIALMPEPLPAWLRTLDDVVLGLFVVEIALRILTFRPGIVGFYRDAPIRRALAHVGARVRYAVEPLNLLDILSILALVPALRGLRALRLLRLARGFRIFRYASPLAGIERAFVENRLLYGFAFSVLGIEVLIGGVTMYALEAGSNESLDSLGDGLWWAIVTITTVGFGDITPTTDLGRIVGAVVMVVGMFTLALFAAVIGHTLVGVVLTIREEHFRMSEHYGHIVVCGYDSGARTLLETLLEERIHHGREIVIMADAERPPECPTELSWVRGDPTKESELDKARVAQAGAVLVIGKRGMLPQQADAVTILTVFTIRSYLRRQPQAPERTRELHVVAEILDPENASHARTAGSNEVIETTRVGFSLLSHALVMPGTAETILDVVSFSELSLYIGRWDRPEPRPFGALAQELKRESGMMVIGVRPAAGGPQQLNPPDDLVVDQRYHLLYLADRAVLPPP